jgi:hypothetical protein
MHNLLEVACRRSAGIAAGVILTGGLAGGVLLTPAAAYATTAVNTTTAITGTAQTPTFHGTTLNVQVSVTPANTTNGTPTGTVQVSGAGGGCSVTLNSAGAGSCNIFNLPDGNYSLTASYAGVTNTFNSSASSPATAVTIGRAPVFVADSPSLTATNGQFYSYTFRAVGSPGIHYSLSGGFPGLHINPFTGTVSGTVPNFSGSFSYSVTATNGVGSATAGPYTVNLRHFGANLRTFLNCTSKVFTGQRGTCTLFVTNRGFSSAPDVTAQIALPSQLRADFCGFFNFNFNFGCRIFDNTAHENLGTLRPGQTKELTVVFTAKTGFNLWGWQHGHRFTVRVFGSASSFGGFPFFQRSVSFANAFVTIIPRGWWA